MKSRAIPSFWKQYHALPKDIQELATQQYRQWISNPSHPSLHFKKVKGYWSARVSEDYRALGIMDGDTVIWFFIGTHEKYDKLLKR